MGVGMDIGVDVRMRVRGSAGVSMGGARSVTERESDGILVEGSVRERTARIPLPPLDRRWAVARSSSRNGVGNRASSTTAIAAS